MIKIEPKPIQSGRPLETTEARGIAARIKPNCPLYLIFILKGDSLYLNIVLCKCIFFYFAQDRTNNNKININRNKGKL